MSLKDLVEQGRLEQRNTSKQEISDLLRVAARSLSDAGVEQLSLDGRFNCAYEAALLLATIPMRCAGYRTRGEGHHLVVFDMLPEIVGEDMAQFALYLQKCRKIRNLSTYSRSGIVSKGEVMELIGKVQELDEAVRRWMATDYPQYCRLGSREL